MPVEPSDLSPSGEYVVGSAKVEGNDWEYQAFAWSRATGAEVISAERSHGISVADDGTIVGVATEQGGGTVGTMWTLLNNAFEVVDEAFPRGDLGFIPQAISGNGQAIVGFLDFDISESFAVRWDIPPTAPLELAGRDVFSRARSVSSDGSRVVGSKWTFDGSGLHRSGIWSGDEFEELDGFDDSNQSVNASGISPDGSVVVGGGFRGDTWLWSNGEVTDLTDLLQPSSVPGLFIQGSRFGISNLGQVVVGTDASGEQAALWTNPDGVRLIQEIVANAGYVEQLNDFTLEAAVDISSDGRVILGRGRDSDGSAEAWLLELPYPGDANGDEQVTFADFLLLSATFGLTDSGLPADFNFDGQVTFADFLVLSSNFGTGSSRVVSVPEPSHVGLVAILGVVLSPRMRTERKNTRCRNRSRDER